MSGSPRRVQSEDSANSYSSRICHTCPEAAHSAFTGPLPPVRRATSAPSPLPAQSGEVHPDPGSRHNTAAGRPRCRSSLGWCHFSVPGSDQLRQGQRPPRSTAITDRAPRPRHVVLGLLHIGIRSSPDCGGRGAAPQEPRPTPDSKRRPSPARRGRRPPQAGTT